MASGHWDTINLYPLTTFTNPAAFPIDVPRQRGESRTWLISHPDWNRRSFAATIGNNPDYDLSLGCYKWRVHRKALIEHSRFFRTIMTGHWQEAHNSSTILHDDSPWIVGRLIQYLYTGTFDYTHARQCRPPHPGLELPEQPRVKMNTALTLSSVMQHLKDITTYTADKEADGRLSMAEIDMAMYMMADKYGIPKLRGRVLESFEDRTISPDFLIKTCTPNFRGAMDRDHELKRAIAKRVANIYKKLRTTNSAWIENWVKSDPSFALIIMDRMEHVGDKPYTTVKKWDDQAWIEEWDKRPVKSLQPISLPQFPTFTTTSDLSNPFSVPEPSRELLLTPELPKVSSPSEGSITATEDSDASTEDPEDDSNESNAVPTLEKTVDVEPSKDTSTQPEARLFVRVGQFLIASKQPSRQDFGRLGGILALFTLGVFFFHSR